MNIAIIDFDDIRNPLLAAGQARATMEVGKWLANKGYTLAVICSHFPWYEDRVEKKAKEKTLNMSQ